MALYEFKASLSLCRKFHDSQGYTMRHCPKKKEEGGKEKKSKEGRERGKRMKEERNCYEAGFCLFV